ncbi:MULTISPECIES: FAD/NAD(P)-binding protein [Nocardia]|uniref:FAD/NAD(P)-binding protein n=1 Tax=Nocardia TaxID=1817 RepID=UPI0002E61F01|nr:MULTISPECIES: FAD/NAD(P)-binding protein [Nocardia]
MTGAALVTASNDVSARGRRPRLAIIGMGPRGLTVFERLCANLRRTPDGTTVEVVLVDAVRIGTGGVWRVDQPRHLLMNTVASQISVFTDESVDMCGPVQLGPSLYDWARYIRDGGESELPPRPVRTEAARLTPDSYPTRAFFGHYLLWSYQHLRRLSRGFLEVTEIQQTVVDIVDEDGAQQIRLRDGRRIGGLDAVLLSQGHLPATQDEPPPEPESGEHGPRTRRLGPGNPADLPLGEVAAGEAVIVRGLGLCFFDHLALLTEGRGGRFVEDDAGLRYTPSGREPLILAGSRRGVPYQARGENQKGVSARHTPLLLTPARILEFRERALRRGDLEFRRDIWPLIATEVETVYYTRLLHERLDATALHSFRAEFLRAPWNSPDTIDLLNRTAVPAEWRWHWERVIDPARGRRFADPNAFQQWLLHHLDDDVRMARQGNLDGPVKAALDVLRDLRNEVRLVVDHAGITGSSYREDLDRWYTPMNAFLSIGPPAHRIAEMAALIRAGILVLIGPGLRVRREDDRFVADSPTVGGSRVSARCLIEARLPEPDIRRTDDPLMRSLLGRGESRCYTVPDPTGRDYRTGGLEVTTGHRVVDHSGRAHPRRFALGVPTEKVRWVTAAGPRPGVNSVTFADADHVARSMLASASVPLEPAACLGCPT